ncbi:MAG TPA: C40 family peptidase [Actinocrinis sp.]|nr:C40 family peptidase [Actinocrinis sp.]
MASHRQSKTPSRTAAATMVGLTAGAVALVPTISEAAPAQTFQQVQTEVNNLYTQSEAATQQYDGAQQAYAQLQQKIADIQGQISIEAADLHSLQKMMGLQAGSQYITGGVDPSLQLALSADPNTFLAQASIADETGQLDAAQLKELQAIQAQLKQDQANAAALLAQQQTQVATLAASNATIKGELSKAQQLLRTLTPQQQAQVENGGNGASQTTFNGPLPPVSGRAAAAVAYAESKVGDWYKYAGNGPDVFDCSGLTQESWKAAGVSIPRTSYAQYDALPHVALSALQPGDLVFFFPGPGGPGHVGIYIGGGEIVHAPKPGAKVQYASLYGSDMPIVGAARP